MKTNRTTIALNLLTVFGLTVASVSGMTMTYDSSIPALQQTINVRFDGTNTSIYAGEIGVRFDNGITALLFCADPFTALRSGPVDVTPLTTNQFTNGGRLAWMFNTYVPTFTQSWQAAAFQLATWDIVADNGNGFGAGRIQSNSNTTAQILNFANTMLAASQNKSGTGATFYAPTNGPTFSQTLFRADNPVPEPSTYLLMGIGLIGLSQLRRRK